MSENKEDLSALNPKAQAAAAELQLLPGENILRVWEGDGFFLGSNPLAKAIAKIQQFMMFICCGHLRVFIIVTNMRIIIAYSNSIYCGTNATRSVKTVALASLQEAGIIRDTSCCCFHSRMIQLQTRTEVFSIVVKRFKDEDLKEFLEFLGRVLVNNSGAK